MRNDRKLQTYLRDALSRGIQNVIMAQPEFKSHPEFLYAELVAALMESMLGNTSLKKPQFPALRDTCRRVSQDIAREIGPMSPEKVGKLYEFLRGLRVDVEGSAPTLNPSARSRRNQGLFYTPPHVARHILQKALDSLDIGSPLDYLHLRILDPAMGTGVFLAEALDELMGRVLPSSPNGVPPCPDMPGSAHAYELRRHILSHCLYGVDLDPIAVSIARSVLLLSLIHI